MDTTSGFRRGGLVGFLLSIMVITGIVAIKPAQAQQIDPVTPVPSVEPTLTVEPGFDPTETPPDEDYELGYKDPPYLSPDGTALYNASPILIIKQGFSSDAGVTRITAIKGLQSNSEITIDYMANGEVDTFGNTCQTFPDDARTAIRYAADIWEPQIHSTIPITVLACWSNSLSPETLGVGGGQPARASSDFPKSGTWYVGAVANAIKEKDYDPDKYDMHISFNNQKTWYTGTDGFLLSTEVDLVTVAMHEIGHGLGFAGSAKVYEDPENPGVFLGKIKLEGKPYIYDTYMVDIGHDQLLDYENDSEELGDALTSGVWFAGPYAMQAYLDNEIQMYTPRPWEKGSSYSHFQVRYDTQNELMLPVLNSGVAKHAVGPIEKGVLKDCGWAETKGLPPDLYSPHGIIYTRTPTFKWTPIVDATSYQIRVYEGTTKILDKTVGCTTDPCSYKPSGILLKYAFHTWQVKAYVNDKWTDFSPTLSFKIQVPISKLLAPDGKIYDRKPVYSWTGSTGIDSYEIVVYQGGTMVVDSKITAAIACSGTSCKTTPNKLLKFANHTWTVRAQDEGNWSVTSGEKAFSVLVVAPTTKKPTGNLYTKRPTFTWIPNQYASDYQLQVFKGTSKVVDKTVTKSVCTTSLCSYTLTSDLAYADHTWKLSTKAEGVWSEWSSAKSFTVIGPPTPSLPSGNTYTRQPTYKWSKVTGATQYKFEVYQGTTLVDTQTVSSSVCGTTTCEYKPTSKVLDYKVHSWKVSAYAAGAWQYFSAAKSFTVINPVPVAKSPTGTIYDSTPTFKWTKITGATKYRFEVANNITSTIIYTQTISSPTCDATTCSNTPVTSLAFNTTLKWRVQSYAGGAWQTYSAYLTFTPRTDTPVLQSPSGFIYVLKPTYKWTPVFNAESYEVQLTGGLWITYSVPASACSGGVCSKVSEDALNYDSIYSWRARAKVNGEWKPWTSYLDFNVINPIPVPLNPTGLMYAYTPIMSWKEVPGAAHYYIEVYHQDGSFVDSLNISVPSCANSVCEERLDFNLDGTNYDYKWRIQSQAGGIMSGYSNYKEFHYQPIYSGSTVRTSLTLNGTEANSHSKSPAISANGKRIAFMSNANNMGEWVYDYTLCIFVYDLDEGTTRMVSRVFEGYQTYENADYPAISGNGRYVGFSSESDKMVPNDTNGEISDVFLHDTQTGIRVIISVNNSGVQGNEGSNVPFVSNDGRYVAFQSGASNLVPGDTNNHFDVFVRDVLTNTTERVSVSSSGAQANSSSMIQGISADGNYVIFLSNATNLVAGDTNGVMDVFVHNRSTGVTIRVSTASDGSEAVDFSAYASISDDGRFVTFSSRSYNLVTADTNEFADVFLKDTLTGAITRISIAKDGPEANNRSEFSRISGDGLFVVFSSDASNLIGEGIDSNYSTDVFLYDVSTQTITRVSVSTSGAQAAGDSDKPVLSFDGQYIAFWSEAINLVSGDANNRDDIFLHLR